MTAPEDDIKQRHALERIREQAELRGQQREVAAVYDAESEQIRGENERNAMRLRHDLDIENRQLDLQADAFRDGQKIRLESLQTTIKQHDDYFRHFWELDKELVTLEGRIAELIVAAGLQQQQTKLDHHNAMQAKEADHSNQVHMEAEKRISATHENELDKDNFEFKERLKIQLAREFGTVSRENINETVDRLFREGKFL